MNRMLVLAALVFAAATGSPLSHAQAPWFEVVVAGPQDEPVPLQGVDEVSVDDIVFDYRDLGRADARGNRLYGPGKPHWGSARITLQPGPDADWLHQWFREVSSGKSIRKSISVVLFRTTSGEPVREYIFHDCLPLRWKAPELNSADGTGKAAGTITVKIGRIEFTTRIQPPSSPPGNVSVSLADEDGDIGTDSWDSWAGGAPLLHMDQLFGGAKYRTNSPGHKSVGELTLRGGFWLSKKGYDYWMARALEGKPRIKGLVITESAAGRPSTGRGAKPARQYTYHDCFPVRYVFPRMSVTNTTGNTMEEVTIKPIRVELK